MNFTPVTQNHLDIMLQAFGKARSDNSSDIFEKTVTYYSYVCNGVQIGIAPTLEEDAPAGFSVFGCARAGMNPTMGLYRYISLWRSSAPIGAPYVTEGNEGAAVICDYLVPRGTIAAEALANTIVMAVDSVLEITMALANDLAGADGYRLEERAPNGDIWSVAGALFGLWQITDPRIEGILGR